MSQAEFTRGFEDYLERRGPPAPERRQWFTRLELRWLAKVCARAMKRRSR